MISIICRCFNMRKYIDKCITSILNQSYKDFEIIIVDDCSTDNTIKILSQYNDPRIKIIKHDINKGIGFATKTGIENSSGEWLSFIDPDDWVEYDFLKNLYFCAIENNSDVVGCSTIHYDNKYNILKDYSWIYDSRKTYYGYDKRIKDKHGLTFNNKLIKSELLKELSITPLRLYEDNCNMAKAMFKANKYTVIPYKGYNYLHRNGSLTSNGNNILYRLLVLMDWWNYSQDIEWINFMDLNNPMNKVYKIYFNINKEHIKTEYPEIYYKLIKFCKLC